MAKNKCQTKYKKAPGAPKRFKSAFLFFSENEHRVIRERNGNKKIRAADAAKLVSHTWKKLSLADRSRWEAMALLDRDRYEREKAAYSGPWRIPIVDYPDPPMKKPMSAYFAFSNERRKAISQANPSLSNGEISSLLSKLWKQCPEELKKVYRDAEAREREAFKKCRTEWERERDRSLVLASTAAPSSSTGTSGSGPRLSSSLVPDDEKQTGKQQTYIYVRREASHSWAPGFQTVHPNDFSMDEHSQTKNYLTNPPTIEFRR